MFGGKSLREIEPNVKLERCVPKFSYLGDTFSAGGVKESASAGGVKEAARARVRCAWTKFYPDSSWCIIPYMARYQLCIIIIIIIII